MSEEHLVSGWRIVPSRQETLAVEVQDDEAAMDALPAPSSHPFASR